jgi:hypothetical protein
MGIYISKVTEKKKKPAKPANPYGLQVCKEQELTGLVLDVIDTADPSFLTMEYKAMSSSPKGIGSCRSDVQLLVHDHADAVGNVINGILEIVEKQGKIRLLRISGHGLPGYQSIWGGPLVAFLNKKGATDKDLDDLKKAVIHDPTSRVGLGYWNLLSLTGQLMRLCPCFAPKAEVWLMGCQVAAEKEGFAFISQLSLILGVPVQAGVPIQFASKSKPEVNFLHEGKVKRGAATLNPFTKAQPK